MANCCDATGCSPAFARSCLSEISPGRSPIRSTTVSLPTFSDLRPAKVKVSAAAYERFASGPIGVAGPLQQGTELGDATGEGLVLIQQEAGYLRISGDPVTGGIG